MDMFGAGAGASLGGAIVGGVGQYRGAKAAQNARLRQLAEQEMYANQQQALQAQADREMVAQISQDPMLDTAQAQQVQGVAPQRTLAALGTDPSGNQQLQQQAMAQAATAQQQQGQQGAAQQAGLAQGGRLQHMAMSQQETRKKMGHIQNLADVAAGGYDAEVAEAGNTGAGLRSAGSLLQAGGGGVMQYGAGEMGTQHGIADRTRKF